MEATYKEVYLQDHSPSTVENIPKTKFCRLTLNEILTIVCATFIPIILGIYTGVTSMQEQKQADEMREFDLNRAAELRQQAVYDKFLDDMYKLDMDGYLDDTKNPWSFANARYRAAHRQWDTTRKGDALQFLKEHKLIGKAKTFDKHTTKAVFDIISLAGLNFDNVQLASATGALNPLNLDDVVFDRVSMNNAQFSFVNLKQASFSYARFNNVKFLDASLANAHFDNTELGSADFGNSDLTDTQFLNVNLSTTKLTQTQIGQAIFFNSTLPNGTAIATTNRRKLFSLFYISSESLIVALATTTTTTTTVPTTTTATTATITTTTTTAATATITTTTAELLTTQCKFVVSLK